MNNPFSCVTLRGSRDEKTWFQPHGYPGKNLITSNTININFYYHKNQLVPFPGRVLSPSALSQRGRFVNDKNS